MSTAEAGVRGKRAVSEAKHNHHMEKSYPDAVSCINQERLLYIVESTQKQSKKTPLLPISHLHLLSLSLVNPHPQQSPHNPTMPTHPYRPTPPQWQYIPPFFSPLHNSLFPLALLKPLNILVPNPMCRCIRGHCPKPHYVTLVNLLLQPALASPPTF